MPFATVRDGQLYYEVHGNGETLLLVTGLGGNASFWGAQLPRLARRFRVVVHDHRGSGQSSMSRITYSVEQMAADVVALMDELEIKHAHFVGHSTGGAIGQVLAIEHPGRLNKLVISSSWTKSDPYYRRVFAVRREILERGGIVPYFRAATLFFYPAEWMASNNAAVEAAEAAMIKHAPPIEIMLAKIEAVLKFDRTAELSRIRTPTLVNCAADDILTPAYFSRALAAAIPGAQLKIMRSGGHFNPITVPAAYLRQLLAFLS